MPGRLSDHGTANNGKTYRHTTSYPPGVLASGDDDDANNAVSATDQALTFYRHKETQGCCDNSDMIVYNWTTHHYAID